MQRWGQDRIQNYRSKYRAWNKKCPKEEIGTFWWNESTPGKKGPVIRERQNPLRNPHTRDVRAPEAAEGGRIGFKKGTDKKMDAKS